jgi:lysophospholipase L1-like esterase
MRPSFSRLWLWRAPALLGTLAALVFAGGFVLALRGSLGDPLGEPPSTRPTASAPAKKAGRSLLLVLGDSLARGTGDEAGKGYASDVFDGLKKSGSADIANLAVNGAESGDVLKIVETPNVERLAAGADWILLSVGGNDLSHAVPRELPASGSPLDTITAARTRYADNLREILRRLREANSQVPIYLLGLYDPFGQEGKQARLGASVILTWNNLIEEIALSFPAVFVVPTFDLFYQRPDRLAPDHFHPNGTGHQAIAERVLQLLPAGQPKP